MTKYLVTGGAGFIGSNFIRALLSTDDAAVVTNLDLLTYAGVPATVAELDRAPRHSFVHGDIGDAGMLAEVVPGHDVIVNCAAETHVDRSITDPAPFLTTNVAGTATLLDTAHRLGVPTFVHVSTDEVYGSIDAGAAEEDAPLRPSSPYAASKAAADLLIGAYATTHGYPAITTRCTNNYGPYQFPEKVIPLFVTNLIDGRAVPLYGDGSNERDWLHVEDHCAAILTIIEAGTPGEIYNVGAGSPISNRELTDRLLEVLGLDDSLVERVPDRPGHDFRYAVDASRVRALGWRPRRSLGEGLAETVDWYRNHEAWWRPLRGEA
jgi:dTDP-glucose 4,6-dehydratase